MVPFFDPAGAGDAYAVAVTDPDLIYKQRLEEGLSGSVTMPVAIPKVQSGDTLFGVAQKHGMSVASLRTLNPGLESDKIIVGQSLGVTGKARNAPAGSPTPAPATRTISTKDPQPKVDKAPKAEPVPEPEPRAVSSIIVMEEITFSDFARKHGTTTSQLNALNGLNLKRDITLAKGSELYVPGR